MPEQPKRGCDVTEHAVGGPGGVENPGVLHRRPFLGEDFSRLLEQSEGGAEVLPRVADRLFGLGHTESIGGDGPAQRVMASNDLGKLLFQGGDSLGGRHRTRLLDI